jgi:hypothetical protein
LTLFSCQPASSCSTHLHTPAPFRRSSSTAAARPTRPA